MPRIPDCKQERPQVRSAQEPMPHEQVTRLSAHATEAFDRAMQATSAPGGVQRLRRGLGRVQLPVGA